MAIEYLVSVDEKFDGPIFRRGRVSFDISYRLALLTEENPDWERFGNGSGQFKDIPSLTKALVNDYKSQSNFRKDYCLHILPGNLQREDSALIEFDYTNGTNIGHSFSRPFNYNELKELYKEVYSIIFK